MSSRIKQNIIKRPNVTTNRKSLEKVTISDLLTFYFERSFTYPGNATGSKGLRVLKREAPLMCDTEPELVNLQRVRTLIFRLNSADLSVCEFQRGGLTVLFSDALAG